jgi:hypothetical protein
MQQALTYMQTLALAVLVGKVIFLSFVVAPVLARTLEPEPFGRVVRALFPAYYGLGAGAATLGLGALAGLTLAGGGMGPAQAAAGGLWLGVLTIELYCRSPLTPQTNALRDEIKAQEGRGPGDMALHKRWNALHRRSVQLNSVVMVLGLCLIGLT